MAGFQVSIYGRRFWVATEAETSVGIAGACF